MKRYSRFGNFSRGKHRFANKSIANNIGSDTEKIHPSIGANYIHFSPEVNHFEVKSEGSQCISTTKVDEKFGPRAKICFPTESDELDTKDKKRLDWLIYDLKMLANQTEITIDVIGFADSRGDSDYNEVLSERRAYSVKSYLKEKISSTANKIHLEHDGGGEIGPDTPGLESDDLNDYRIVTVGVRGFDEQLPNKGACENIRMWLEAGIFQNAWGNGKIVFGDEFIRLLQIIAQAPEKVTSPTYKDSFPSDLYIDFNDYNKFQKDWDREKYHERGGIKKKCGVFNSDKYVYDYTMRARKFLKNSKAYHSTWHDDFCYKAARWGKSDGTPRLDRAHHDIAMYLSHKESKILLIRKNARDKANELFDWPCEECDDLKIISTIIADLENIEGTFYNVLLDMPNKIDR